ncbi:MAG TPA: acetoacetate decarboxylase family protein [Blastocatellia bacterium]|nr:acetoacetate decarboxylase family protein [Blastocatellia bacterium]
MGIPDRIKRQQGRFAMVDGIPFKLPVSEEGSPAFMAAFTINPDKARKLLPGNELFPLIIGDKALLMFTVIDYRKTVIGKYIEFAIGIACTHGEKPSPPVMPALLMQHFGTGQFILDLPVSSEISVKGGKGIWGMPKHQANLDFNITDKTVSSQYDLDGQLCVKIEIDRPKLAIVPLSMSTISYAAFRGLLLKSNLYFEGKAGFNLFKKGSARLYIGPHPRVAKLKELEINPDPIMTAFFPETTGTLDDHFEGWFLSYDQPPEQPMDGMESVVNLGLSEEWLAPPSAPAAEDELV